MHEPSSLDRPGVLAAMDWSEVREPGSYLHLASGLIARVYPEELSASPDRPAGVGAVVRLDANPHAAIAALREIAHRHGHQVRS